MNKQELHAMKMTPWTSCR